MLINPKKCKAYYVTILSKNNFYKLYVKNFQQNYPIRSITSSIKLILILINSAIRFAALNHFNVNN